MSKKRTANKLAHTMIRNGADPFDPRVRSLCAALGIRFRTLLRALRRIIEKAQARQPQPDAAPLSAPAALGATAPEPAPVP